MIPVERLEAAKQYMRVDFDEDDALIESLIVGADRYLYNAGIIREDDPEEYDTVVYDMVLNRYDNRGRDIASNRYDNRGEMADVVTPMARLILNQLKFCAGLKKAAENNEETDSGASTE